MRTRESIALMALAAIASSAPAAQLALPPFTAVELHDGGQVIVSYGPEPRVEQPGNGRTRDISVRDGRLVIGHCRRDCGERHGGPIEVEMPRIDAASVESGGSIEVRLGFPAQATLDAAVHHGGIVDVRGLAAARVTATVAQGGLILTRPGEALDASVSHGGVVTYWGRPSVRRSVRGGGDVVRGDAEDADRPLAELRPAPPAVPPPVPPIPPLPRFSH